MIQETRGWDEYGKDFSQRKGSHDYRYFLIGFAELMISEFIVAKLSNFTRAPWERRDHLSSEYGFQDAIVEMYVTDVILEQFSIGGCSSWCR